MIECSFGPSGVLDAPHPRQVPRGVVQPGDRVPGHPAVGGTEEALRRRARVPRARLGRVPGSEPERVIHDPAFLACRRFREGGRPRRFLPAAAEVRGAKDRRPEVAGLRRREKGLSVARVEHHVADDVPEEVRSVGSPGLPAGGTVVQPRALASGDEDEDAGTTPAPSAARGGHRSCSGRASHRSLLSQEAPASPEDRANLTVGTGRAHERAALLRGRGVEAAHADARYAQEGFRVAARRPCPILAGRYLPSAKS